jgi:hypothetical protein
MEYSEDCAVLQCDFVSQFAYIILYIRSELVCAYMLGVFWSLAFPPLLLIYRADMIEDIDHYAILSMRLARRAFV